MTLIGIWIERDHAFAWADSESYDDKKPAGHVLKLAVNERMMVAGVASGQIFTMSAIKQAVAQAANFDELVDRLPTHLRMHRNFWEATKGIWTCATVGWSRRFGRLIGAFFRTQSNYEATFVTSFSMPYVRGLKDLYPGDASDVFSFARTQMTEVQREVPLAGDGLVTVARISRSAIETVHFDLATGRRHAGMPDGVGVETIDRATRIRRADIQEMRDFPEVYDAPAADGQRGGEQPAGGGALQTAAGGNSRDGS